MWPKQGNILNNTKKLELNTSLTAKYTEETHIQDLFYPSKVMKGSQNEKMPIQRSKTVLPVEVARHSPS